MNRLGGAKRVLVSAERDQPLMPATRPKLLDLLPSRSPLMASGSRSSSPELRASPAPPLLDDDRRVRPGRRSFPPSAWSRMRPRGWVLVRRVDELDRGLILHPGQSEHDAVAIELDDLDLNGPDQRHLSDLSGEGEHPRACTTRRRAPCSPGIGMFDEVEPETPTEKLEANLGSDVHGPRPARLAKRRVRSCEVLSLLVRLRDDAAGLAEALCACPVPASCRVAFEADLVAEADNRATDLRERGAGLLGDVASAQSVLHAGE